MSELPPPNAIQPRVQAPAHVARDEIFEIRTLITHVMETGLRHDADGHVIPRDLIHRFTCFYNGRVVFDADFHEAVAENPYLSFFVRAAGSGTLRFVWEEDDGATTTLEAPITVA